MATINELKWTTLTAAVNAMKSPNQFLRRLLFSNHVPLPTEDIELGLFSKNREIAPFVRKNGEAIMVAGYSQAFQTVGAPNIRIKRPFTPSELLFGRQPGTVIFSTGADMQISAVQQHIARDVQVMADLITNAEEYLCAQAIQGTISYEVADQEVFTVTFPKPSGHNVTLSTFWNDATPANTDVLENFHTAKALVADEVGLAVTHCILGSEAATSFRRLAKLGLITLDNRTLTTGSVDLTQAFREDGAIYLGNVGGVEVWEYSRTAYLSGVATPMIRAKYAEFLAVTPSAERILYYGAIPDMKALQGRLFQGERFSKSWEVEDPSALMALAHSRPLPTPRKPGAGVSMKVISG